jgi:hypothetical protein
MAHHGCTWLHMAGHARIYSDNPFVTRVQQEGGFSAAAMAMEPSFADFSANSEPRDAETQSDVVQVPRVPNTVVVVGLFCMKVKVCKLCKCGSNTVNTVKCGPDAIKPAIPWLYGDHVHPGGDYCKLCFNTFKHAGFAEEYGTIGKFLVAGKVKNTLVDEFMAARAEFVMIVNMGKVPLRARAAQGQALRNVLSEARKQFVEFIQSTAIVGETTYTAVDVSLYKLENEGRHPRDDGHKVRLF